MSASSILSVKGVNKRFGGLKALDDVNLEIAEGSVHAIIGPNGAGKSTLLNTFVGRLDPDEGSVVFQDQSLLGRTPDQINQLGVSRVFQTPEIFEELTCLDNVMIPAFSKRDGAFKSNMFSQAFNQTEVVQKAEAALEEVGMADKRLDDAANLSRGDKRRLELAMCLVQDPRLLLLDEPTAGMSRADTNRTIELLQKIGKERGITKVIIEHDMHVVFSLSNRISVMAQGGVIFEGTPQEARESARVQEAYLAGGHEE